ncbi:amidohydrolase [Liquorilactobacillus oeni]|uniref:Amidohydrolase n=1 Tax=Liquorilactobacillus oeni DSM 19972 TaxID=1423777 RepID=A0A0R1MGT9_9LACO|nr:amidohydrolase [Liquorilactobacillus oeni]KRL04549.1 amidohydrolase [Liquorilactobacillus oeni DSM 19972]
MNDTVDVTHTDTELSKKIINIFTELHRHPEVSNKEEWTTAFVKDKLSAAGIKVLNTGIKTGVIAEITGEVQSKRTIALRADIDALPVLEKTGLKYCSLNDGISHACGHDFHTAALLVAAEILNKKKDQLEGSIRLIFEPGEENHTGAKLMIAAGALTGVSAIFGMHNMPTIPCGMVALKSGALMASNDNFQVAVHGISAHAAMPHTGKDPIVTAATIITTLQSIISRNTSPFDSAIVTIGSISGGKVNNVIPDEVIFKGTIRTFSEEERNYIKERFTQIVTNVGTAYGQQTAIDWDKGPSPVNNDLEITATVNRVAEKFMKVVTAQPSCADDDFATYEERVPGCYAFIGSQGSSNLHHSDLVVNPKALIYAVKLHVDTALALLNIK